MTVRTQLALEPYERGLRRKVSGERDWHVLGVADSNWRTPRAVFVGLGDDLLITGLFRVEAGALFLRHHGQPVIPKGTPWG